jgi:parallel beta-helix repeat protein
MENPKMQRFRKGKPYFFTFLMVCVSVLVFASQVQSFNGNLESQPRYFDATQSYRYLIETNGTHHFILDGINGKLDYESTNASAVINNAIRNLTSGRTWNERVVMKGYFTLDSPIYLWSYTTLDLTEAYLKAADRANTTLIVSYNLTSPGNTNIEIYGGVLDGNKANQYQTEANRLLYDPTGLGDFWTNGILFRKTSNSKVVGTYIKNTLMHGLACKSNCYFNTFENCIFEGCGRTGVTYQYQGGISLAEDTSYNNIVNCVTTGNLNKGIYVSGCSNNLISGNRVHDEPGQGGIVIGVRSYNNRVINNAIWKITHVPSEYAGTIYVYNGGHHNLIEGNSFKTINCAWICLREESYTRVTNNVWDGTGSSLSITNCFGLTFYGNLGFVTENSGCAVSCHNGSWIRHGLAGDPSTTGSITLSLRGLDYYNTTMILRVPTVVSSNATHFQIDFYMWETAGWTLVPVTAVEAQMVYWDATYKP